jgi:hypothetical protein
MQPTISDRRSRLLYHWRGREGSLTPLTGQTPTFARATAGGAVFSRNHTASIPVHSQPRWEAVDLDGDGIRETLGLRIDDQRTNIALRSCLFNVLTTWSDGGKPATESDVVSCIAGQLARKFTGTNPGSDQGRFASAGTYVDAQVDCYYAIFENVDAVTSQIGFYDSAGGGTVGLCVLTWATMALSGSPVPTNRGVIDLGIGPNGGRLALIWLTVTGTAGAGLGGAGHTRTMLLYPVGSTSSTLTAIIHAAQMEANAPYPTSLNVTVAAGVTRNADAFTHALDLGTLTAENDDFTIYGRVARPVYADAAGALGVNPGVAQLGEGPGGAIGFYFTSGSRSIQAQIDTPTADATASLPVPAGRFIEVCAQFQDLTVGGRCRIDVGSGFGSLSGATATPITTFGAAHVKVGRWAERLGGVVCDIKIARWLGNMAELREAF